MYRSTHHPFSPPLLHTNTLHTTVNPATAYASSLDTKSYTGEFVLSITFRRRLLHAVSYASLLPLSLYASLHVRHLVLHRRPIVAQQILRQLVLLLPLSLQQPLLPTVHPLRRAHIDFRLLRFPLARRDSSFRFFRCSARERPSSACISFPVSTNCSISCFCCITFRSPRPSDPSDPSDPSNSKRSPRSPRGARSNSSNSSNSSKSATAAKRAALPAVVRPPPRFWRVSGRRRSRSRRVLPAGKSSFFQKWRSRIGGVFSFCRGAF